jgi:predicted site-specific integrase-resolvase
VADRHKDAALQGGRPFYYRRRDTAAAMGVSETVILQWERAGLLKAVRLPGLRAVRHWHEDVDALARKLRGVA